MKGDMESQEICFGAKSWPFEEARKLLNRTSDKGYMLFETGYGPSGLPHIGTFGEVVRTSYVRHAFSMMSDIPTKLFVFSDDRDALRKVPDNIPNPEKMVEFLGAPVTEIPDPFGKYESFGHHNNARLREFLDSFGFEYQFVSATECYKSGLFNDILLKILHHSQSVLDIMLPSLREERASTYSPFLPIVNGRVLQVPVVEYRDESIVFRDEDGTLHEVPVTDGHCKLQWKVDWAARWCVLGVDYEMSGKDLIDSVKLSSKICRTLGYNPPDGFNYELFLDSEGKKISKSKGNGLSVEEWLQYGTTQSLSHFMYYAPKSAKRLSLEVIPRQEDEYIANVRRLHTQTLAQQVDNPVWHIHSGKMVDCSPVTFSLLLNLASACNAEDSSILLGFVKKYIGNAELSEYVIQMAENASRYYHAFVKPYKQYRDLSDDDKKLLSQLRVQLDGLLVANTELSAEEIQEMLYNFARENFAEVKDCFSFLYQSLLGQTQGPRFGSFIELYGIDNTIALIDARINDEVQ